MGKIAKSKGFDSKNVNIMAGNLHNLPFDDQYFDLVFICSALHHT
ncbi:class I SAM-dependent methyltransferase [Campylobacterota bacterium DY0563]